MRVLLAREELEGFRFRVHLDEGRTVPDPSLPPPEPGQADPRPRMPDPRYVMELAWGKEPPAGQSGGAYLAGIRRELRALCAARLAELRSAEAGPGQVLSLEGEEW
ncbi:MAG: hypothetical protein HY690_18550 [Chloroflexi bacterium]|nr:hypothetical protein [Chloroflexota bacterium]